jgi:hypothetical protein
LETRLGTSVQDFPVSFALAETYIAVTQALAAAITECSAGDRSDIHHPRNGNARACSRYQIK